MEGAWRPAGEQVQERIASQDKPREQMDERMMTASGRTHDTQGTVPAGSPGGSRGDLGSSMTGQAELGPRGRPSWRAPLRVQGMTPAGCDVLSHLAGCGQLEETLKEHPCRLGQALTSSWKEQRPLLRWVLQCMVTAFGSVSGF